MELTYIVISVAIIIIVMVLIICKAKINKQLRQIDQYKIENIRSIELRQELETTKRQRDSLKIQFDKIESKNKILEVNTTEQVKKITHSSQADTMLKEEIKALKTENAMLKEDITLLSFSNDSGTNVYDPTDCNIELQKALQRIDQLQKDNHALLDFDKQDQSSLELKLKETHEKIIQLEKQNLLLALSSDQDNSSSQMLNTKVVQSEHEIQKLKDIIMQQATQLSQFKKNNVLSLSIDENPQYLKLQKENLALEKTILDNHDVYQEKLATLAKQIIASKSDYNDQTEIILKDQIKKLQSLLQQQEHNTKEKEIALAKNIQQLQNELLEKSDYPVLKQEIEDMKTLNHELIENLELYKNELLNVKTQQLNEDNNSKLHLETELLRIQMLLDHKISDFAEQSETISRLNTHIETLTTDQKNDALSLTNETTLAIEQENASLKSELMNTANTLSTQLTLTADLATQIEKITANHTEYKIQLEQEMAILFEAEIQTLKSELSTKEINLSEQSNILAQLNADLEQINANYQTKIIDLEKENTALFEEKLNALESELANKTNMLSEKNDLMIQLQTEITILKENQISEKDLLEEELSKKFLLEIDQVKSSAHETYQKVTIENEKLMAKLKQLKSVLELELALD